MKITIEQTESSFRMDVEKPPDDRIEPVTDALYIALMACCNCLNMVAAADGEEPLSGAQLLLGIISEISERRGGEAYSFLTEYKEETGVFSLLINFSPNQKVA